MLSSSLTGSISWWYMLIATKTAGNSSDIASAVQRRSVEHSSPRRSAMELSSGTRMNAARSAGSEKTKREARPQVCLSFRPVGALRRCPASPCAGAAAAGSEASRRCTPPGRRPRAVRRCLFRRCASAPRPPCPAAPHPLYIDKCDAGAGQAADHALRNLQLRSA